jgi:site-specific DNA recombinase
MDRKKSAVIYARVSIVKQAEEELPIDSQIEKCKAKAESLGARLDRVFVDDGISGTHDRRPAFQDAIYHCETIGADYLVTWSTSRFARNKIDAGLYKRRLAKANTDIVYASMDIDRSSDGGWVTESVLELFDEYYSRQVSADTSRSMIKNAEDGFFNGGRPPYGYQTVPDVQHPKRKRLRPVPHEADLVRDIFKMRLNGAGALTICIDLNSRGLTNRGKKWTKSSILALLRNDAVVGRIVFGRRNRETRIINPRDQWIIVDAHEPIIDMVLWNAVQSRMDDLNPGSNKGSPHSTYLFTGILHCEDGSSMQIESAKGQYKRYWYYNCRSAQKKGSGNNRRISAREFDQWMLGLILDQVFTKENLMDIYREIEDACGSWTTEHRKRRQSVVSSMHAFQQRNNKIYELFELLGKETPNLADLTKRLRENNKKIQKYENELKAIDLEEKPELTVSERDIAELGETLRYIIETTTDVKKLRHFFSSFINRIVVSDTRVRIEYRPECLISNQEPKKVPSNVKWLPEHSLLGTKKLLVDLPVRFRRKAA